MRFTEELNPFLFNKLAGDSDIRSGRVRVDLMSSRSWRACRWDGSTEQQGVGTAGVEGESEKGTRTGAL